MIIEIPNYVDIDVINEIKKQVQPFLPANKNSTYNRDGKTVDISKTPELNELDKKISALFKKIQRNQVRPPNLFVLNFFFFHSKII
jgi:hypothetical protein